MSNQETNQEGKSYLEFGPNKKLAFHVIMGWYAQRIFQDIHLESLEKDQLRINHCMFLSVVSYIRYGIEPSEFEFLMNFALRTYTNFATNFPILGIQSIEDTALKIAQKRMELAVIAIESEVGEEDTTYWKTFLKDITPDATTNQISSKQLRNLVDKISMVVNMAIANDFDFYRTVLKGNSGKSSLKTYTVREADLWGGDKESAKTIETIFSFRPTLKVPANPQTHYKSKIRNIINKAHENCLSDDDYLALEWCARDWLGFARHWIVEDTLKKFIGVWILPALLEEYGYAFQHGEFRDYIDRNETLSNDLRRDFKDIADLFIANLKAFSKRELYNLLKAFQRVERNAYKGTIFDVSTVVKEIEKQYNHKKQ